MSFKPIDRKNNLPKLYGLIEGEMKRHARKALLLYRKGMVGRAALLRGLFWFYRQSLIPSV